MGYPKPKLPAEIIELIRCAKKNLPEEFVAYPLDSGLTIEEFRDGLLKRLEKAKENNSSDKLTRKCSH